MSGLTGKQRMLLDYMRGNGCVLTLDGWDHLIRRGSFASARSLSQVVAALVRSGHVQHGGSGVLATLTEAGKRA